MSREALARAAGLRPETGPDRYARAEMPRFRKELLEFLRIPSVSASAAHRADTRRAAEWLAERMRSAGLDAGLHETPGHPVVVGEWRGAAEGAPTVLVYGHYDVQPPEPLEEWTTPPFEPVVRDGRIVGRGAADDKTQVLLQVQAVEAYRRAAGELPLNLVLLMEGEEEVGSPNLLPFVRSRSDLAAVRHVIVADSMMFGPDRPSLIHALRGLAYFEVEVTGPSHDLHSGQYGGPVRNPANALARILASLHDDAGRVALPGFYDPVRAWDRDALAHLPFDEAAFLQETGAPGLGGEEGYSPLEQIWIRPSCDVNGLGGGYQGEGAKTVLPARAAAKVSFRLVPDQEPGEVAALFRAHVQRVTPRGVRAEVRLVHGARPWRAHPGGPLYAAAGAALEEVFGVPPVLRPHGGTLPIARELEEALGATIAVMGFALPGANMHAPDEWFPLENHERGIRTMTRFYDRMASLAGTARA